ncbi:hypothetical protein HK096_008728, partial [Nowakowskiella sp. JEL0078]
SSQTSLHSLLLSTFTSIPLSQQKLLTLANLLSRSSTSFFPNNILIQTFLFHTAPLKCDSLDSFLSLLSAKLGVSSLEPSPDLDSNPLDSNMWIATACVAVLHSLKHPTSLNDNLNYSKAVDFYSRTSILANEIQNFLASELPSIRIITNINEFEVQFSIKDIHKIMSWNTYIPEVHFDDTIVLDMMRVAEPEWKILNESRGLFLSSLYRGRVREDMVSMEVESYKTVAVFPDNGKI